MANNSHLASKDVFLLWPTIIATAVLLINDFYGKEYNPGWFTGKLSDFAGVFLVTLIIYGNFPIQFRYVLLIVTSTFAFWKSAYSQFLINTFNDTMPFHIGRVIDYSDLFALAVMPLAWLVLQQPHRWLISLPRAKFWRLTFASVMIFSIGASYVKTPIDTLRISLIEEDKTINATQVDDILSALAMKCDYDCSKCDLSSGAASIRFGDATIRYILNKSGTGLLFFGLRSCDGTHSWFGDYGRDELSELLRKIVQQFRVAIEDIKIARLHHSDVEGYFNYDVDYDLFVTGCSPINYRDVDLD